MEITAIMGGREMADNDSGWSFMTGFLLGAIAGGIAGIVMAPKPGTETRANLVERGETWRTKAEEAAANFKDIVGPAVDDIRERIVPMAEQFNPRGSRTGVSEPPSDSVSVSDPTPTDIGPERTKNA